MYLVEASCSKEREIHLMVIKEIITDTYQASTFPTFLLAVSSFGAHLYLWEGQTVSSFFMAEVHMD